MYDFVCFDVARLMYIDRANPSLSSKDLTSSSIYPTTYTIHLPKALVA